MPKQYWKETIWEWCKTKKKIQLEMEKYFNKLTEVNQLLVTLHLHENEVDLRYLQPLGWRNLR